MTQLPNCPACNASYTYTDGTFLLCPQCGHEWAQAQSDAGQEDVEAVKDAHGTVLHDGDTISVIKDLKIKGSAQVVKVGTKVRNIRVLPGEDHNIDCKIDGIGAMKLKSEFVKKCN